MHCQHEWDRETAFFIVNNLEEAIPIISDTWRIRYIEVFNPKLFLSNNLDSITVFGVKPESLVTPTSPHILWLTLSQKVQSLASFGIMAEEWNSLEIRLKNVYNIIYNAGSSYIFIRE